MQEKLTNYIKKQTASNIEHAKKVIDAAYVKAADNLLALNKTQQAIKLLNLSVEFNNSYLAHYKLAQIYEKIDKEKAITHYEKTFKSDSKKTLDYSSYANLLAQKADNLHNSNKKVEAELIYNKVHQTRL
ncbi:MAG: hypothetical protein MZV70_11410 [Desulfobacterales bacterium]|nr:hypothetical protein [Desulfobacterales bacterium]